MNQTVESPVKSQAPIDDVTHWTEDGIWSWCGLYVEGEPWTEADATCPHCRRMQLTEEWEDVLASLAPVSPTSEKP